MLDWNIVLHRAWILVSCAPMMACSCSEPLLATWFPQCCCCRYVLVANRYPRDGCSTMSIAKINLGMQTKSNLPTITTNTILLPLLDFCHGLDIQRLYQGASRCWEVAGFQECTCTTREFVGSFAEEDWLQHQFVGIWLCQHAGLSQRVLWKIPRSNGFKTKSWKELLKEEKDPREAR